MKATVTITEVRRATDILREARRAGARINRAGAEKGVEMARQECPVSDNNDPGHVHLRDTIKMEVDAQTDAATMVAGDPERGVNHALLVEFGTHLTSPNPYFMQGRKFGQKEAERQAKRERRVG